MTVEYAKFLSNVYRKDRLMGSDYHGRSSLPVWMSMEEEGQTKGTLTDFGLLRKRRLLCLVLSVDSEKINNNRGRLLHDFRCSGYTKMGGTR